MVARQESSLLGRSTLLIGLAIAVSVGAAACAGTPVGDDAGGSDAARPRDASRPDAGGPTDAGRPDAGSFEGLGRRCEAADDCPGDGFCVSGPTGDVCTYRCDAECPSGWVCRATDFEGEVVSVCRPIIPPLCSPCDSDAQCPGGACIDLQGEGYCVAICFEASCPTGYVCAADPTGMRAFEYCLPETGSCTCTIENDGAQRTCSTSNDLGTCFGVETCVASEGWSGCDARTPETEVCDGADNDCDFVIDDGVDGSSCVNEVAGVGSCPGVTFCMGEAGIVCQGPTPTVEACNYLDDDCDGTVDEGFGGLGELCSAGIGGCFRQGVVRCSADRASTECSAVAGAPATEACNGIDDDCDGSVDEDFPSLGRSCSGGVGLCARVGTTVCASSGAGTTCSVGPGAPSPEVCNSLDDDCDGSVDEDFRDATSGAYNRDTACGGCGVDCTAIFDLPNAFGTCDVSGGARCVLSCDANAFDLNAVLADGCEFALDPGAIYVSISDPGAVDDAGCGLGPVGTGAGRYPCRTIARGIARATATGRARVLVANGLYDEAVSLANGVSLLGAYRWDTWERELGASATQIRGVGSIGVHQYAVQALSITAPTTFEGFVVRGPVNGNATGNSYALYVSGSTSNLTIRGNVVYGGRGGPGTTGGVGAGGLAGVDGTGRDSAGVSAASYDAFVVTGAALCDASNNRQYTNGGVRTCGIDVVSGGNGGGNRCPVATDRTQYSAINGFTGTAGDGIGGGAGGTGGQGGYDATLTRLMGSTVCYIPTARSGDPIPTYGADGALGRPGSNGAAGLGCSTPSGSVTVGHWVGSAGGAGALGGNGGGGGGGGAGGGAYCDGVHCSNADLLGGHGGGGGSGGCGGTGGNAGSAGGGAFGIFLVGTSTAPVVQSNTIVRGEGGTGGGGGSGGSGGLGGTGAAGGTTDEFCTGPAGRGGNGGSGGHGAGGGGGCGGASFGIVSAGLGATAYCGAASGNTFSGGVGGAGGPGGYSLGNTGLAGGAGALQNCGVF